MHFSPVIGKKDFLTPIDPSKPLNLLMEQKNAVAKKSLAKDIAEELDKLLWADYLIVIAP